MKHIFLILEAVDDFEEFEESYMETLSESVLSGEFLSEMDHMMEAVDEKSIFYSELMQLKKDAAMAVEGYQKASKGKKFSEANEDDQKEMKAALKHLLSVYKNFSEKFSLIYDKKMDEIHEKSKNKETIRSAAAENLKKDYPNVIAEKNKMMKEDLSKIGMSVAQAEEITAEPKQKKSFSDFFKRAKVVRESVEEELQAGHITEQQYWDMIDMIEKKEMTEKVKEALSEGRITDNQANELFAKLQ